jgi:Na+-transporting methylmalonyl-CoA/oxaloacetate decarboxylase gamma subunit
MLEFDINKAVEITYSGAGAAFIVLVFLIVFTIVIGRIARLMNRSVATSGAAAVATSAEDLSQAPIVASIDLTNMGAAGGDEVTGTSDTADWKNYGRLDAFLSRTMRRRDS